MRVGSARSIRGEVCLPGDKSISHRAAIVAAMAVGETRIENFSASADCASTLACLVQLGVEIRRDDDAVTIHGVGKKGFSKPEGPLDCGNSGTTMRLLAGVLAGQHFESVLIGDASLRKRPMRRVIEPLALMGASIDSDDGRCPLTISGAAPLNAIEYELPVASAQIKSCILLAGLNAKGVTRVIERIPTRDHTERMLEWFGVPVERTQDRLSLSGTAQLRAQDVSVPADISAAAFFLVAAALLPDSRVEIPNVGVNPSRTAMLSVLQQAGLNLELRNERKDSNEPVADLYASSASHLSESSITISGSIVANLIDEIPILAVLGTRLDGGIEIRDASELRHKESDRIAAVVENLRLMNADVEEFPDGFRVKKSNLTGAEIDTYGDHRIAMAFAVASLVADGESTIRNAECVDISFPGFIETLRSVVR